MVFFSDVFYFLGGGVSERRGVGIAVIQICGEVLGDRTLSVSAWAESQSPQGGSGYGGFLP